MIKRGVQVWPKEGTNAEFVAADLKAKKNALEVVVKEDDYQYYFHYSYEEKQSHEQKPLPSKMTMAKNLAMAIGDGIVGGFHPASQEEKARRLNICFDCEYYRKEDSRCARCGCYLKFKAGIQTWHCPIEKW